MKSSTIKEININEIKIDEKYYPRRNWDWFTVMTYAKSIKTNPEQEFPPIKIATLPNIKEYILIDGWHRIKAYKQNKITKTKCIILEGFTEQELYIEAVESNNKHGKGYSTGDKIKIINDLTKLDINPTEISKLIQMPIADMKKLVKGRTTYDLKGESIILNPILKGISGNKVNNKEEFEKIQKTLGNTGKSKDNDGTKSQAFLIQQVITMLEQDLFDLSNEKVMEKLITLKETLKTKIK